MTDKPSLRPHNIPKRRLRASVKASWWYEDRRGIDVLAQPTEGTVTWVRITWGELKAAMKRCGVKP